MTKCSVLVSYETANLALEKSQALHLHCTCVPERFANTVPNIN